MTWVVRILAVLGFWFITSIVLFGILPALWKLRRRTAETDWSLSDGDNPAYDWRGDPLDAELRSLFDQDGPR